MPISQETSRRVRFVDDGSFEDLVGEATYLDMEALPEEKRWALTSALEHHLGDGFDSLMGDEIIDISQIQIGETGRCEAVVRFKQVV